ncbi:Archease domain containing protein [Halorhabdus tiamatea SARL4B]|uniref:Archease n=1 Tax=Halorhabdus tiamatea SARL4B TaxID=1033806 RepID=F7PND6_9EURY|nr:archease [Halorhabdus tiamatea]ERJ04544.1 Archease domain containing protein [Halorhabdus tiamatea SARL4B]CCQ34610.1 archease [Halorhabdus tiamatea SARL4B]
MSFTLREHTADVAVEATGETLGDVFGATADGMAAAMYEGDAPEGDRFDLTVTAESREPLLFDYLDELIYQRDVRGVLPVDNRAAVSSSGDVWTVEATAQGVPLQTITAREVKAVTYSEMVLEPTEEGWHAYVVLDV